MPSPLLDEYNRTGVITPPLQRAMDIARNKLAMVVPPAPAATPALTSPSAPGPMIAPPAMANTPALVRSAPPTPQRQELERLTTGETGRAGIDKIQNPWLRGPLKVLEGIGSVVAPWAMVGIPGTQIHHEMLVNHAARRANEESQRNLEAAQAEELPARAAHERAEAQKDLNPGLEPAEAAKTIETDQGIRQWNPATQRYDIDAGQRPDKATKPDIHAMYADAVADAFERGVDPKDDPKVQQIAAAMQETQRQPTPKEPARDDKAIAIYQKPENQRTPEEKAYLAGYEKWVDKTKVQPGLQRAQIFVSGRPLQVIDPDNPENVTYMPAGQAMKTGAAAPASIPFQTEKGVARAFTSGVEARTLNAFNTAHEHLTQLEQATAALNNGDVQALNRVAQAFATATGSAAPTTFNAIREAVLGEVSKTFKGGQATEGEINALRSTISAAQSPQQLAGAIGAYRQLMESKRHALQMQYESGRAGKPYFGEQSVPTVTTQQQYDALPSGAFYMEDGKRYRKP